ncbi:uncharacterized protein TRAVEDRAFT_135035 [Trametes versicolor FP-101664 SS1]|uniref:uncharacterized protein n=1 Tax=Trametes versicolor (strain FP-101664) TaxID=717944 RepID=UPI00046212AA|nr:uncharacterized protein TRAVEDRAFT_135035 [Trametes versicolor FP-101664 SS1]EIW52721.1 hypothetical protein TRAVEDRAFT_135035 [Trametes versicolor FP-101664 SS1]
MYVYNGKLDWLDYAKDECITIVFPAGFALKDPVCAYWQWTTDAEGNEKRNTCQLGSITTVTKTADQYKITIFFDHSGYSFDSVVAADFKSVTITMRNQSGDTSSAITLQEQLSDACRVPSTEVFTGKLNWFNYAVNDMITFVVPRGVAVGAPVGLYWQWTEDANGNLKQNRSVNSTFRAVSASGGQTTGTFDDGYYTFEATILSDDKSATIHMRNPNGASTTVEAQHTDFRQMHRKKALIIRYGTGIDNGIFFVRDMLVDHLGFDADDVEMLYFSEEPAGAPGVLSDGQAAPSASRFKARFTDLIAGAAAGDVRFLYVDTHGTIRPDDDSSGEADDMDEGWTMAEDDDGIRKEVVYDDWLADTIRANLKPGVNLTILASSCMGGGMLDTHTATPGVLLAGCHETQFNVKALKTNDARVDPWMYAIVATIKNAVKRKRGVPTYSSLFNDAKKYIRNQLAGGSISDIYKGPSPNELEPVPRDQPSNTSHQDPQLIFYSGYLDPDEERFLFPFVAARSGDAEGESVRFPRDQYAHDEL